ncbi:uncharacterized protein ATNIH1004_001228 [Aspergillus tanneri]|uniref:Uncharacterized protein n=1 Tax=Aspergillus tanneri TaxID=1220188 RepID=A0A5M9N412_9EURO|nr:uncharacterized protein ATNIH1004_001228 [Aspergillus tanneri]KAA8652324.1 hypothetical protein ATNIH1004_001228 [Aspergillus tanneri]
MRPPPISSLIPEVRGRCAGMETVLGGLSSSVLAVILANDDDDDDDDDYDENGPVVTGMCGVTLASQSIDPDRR